MKTYATLLLATTLSLSLQQNAMAQSIAPFTAHPVSSLTSSVEMSIPGFTIREENQRIYIDWTSQNNSTSNYFEIETSKDGNNFNLAGLVFASENSGSQDYTFFDKAKAQRPYYRVRIIEKNGNVSYSPVLNAGTEKNKIN